MLNSKFPKIATIDQAMQTFVDEGKISGAVTLVADDKNILHVSAVGERNIEKHLAMQTDTIFWIASMTKIIAAAAILMLQDEKKVFVDDSVATYIPEFAELKTADGTPAEVKLWHLLTHTSGLAEAPGEKAWAAKNLEEVVAAGMDLPLHFEPGTRWEYCQSGINTLGRVVELASRKKFEEFLQERLFDPLGMADATFYPTAEQWQRVAVSYISEGGKLTATPIKVLPLRAGYREHYPAANGGLFCTARDYCRFGQMLLNDGMLEGRRYLTRQSVREMTRNQTGKMKAGFVPGSAWGLGFGVVAEPLGTTQTLSPGTYGHGGAYGTQAWIDPHKRLVQILMIQWANIGNGDDSAIRREFHEAVQSIRAHSPSPGTSGEDRSGA